MFFFFDENEYNEPYNPADIRIESKLFPVFQVMHWIEAGELLLQPEFQRNKIWNRKTRSLLIESLILRIPIPAFYFDEDIQGNKAIIDGLQRITALYDFIAGKYSLYGLQYLDECNGRFFYELSSNYRHRIEDTQLTINILDASCPPLVKYDVFHRINTQGIPLNKQEIRNILMSSRTRELVLRMSRQGRFIDVTHNKVSDRRMDAQELCLRFLACRRIINKDTLTYDRFSDLSDVVDLIVGVLNDMNQSEKEEMYEVFVNSMDKCWRLFGNKAFMKKGRQGKRFFNKAQFVSFSVLLSVRDYNTDKNFDYDLMQQRMDDFIDSNSNYSSALNSTTSSYRHVQAQILYAERFLRENI